MYGLFFSCAVGITAMYAIVLFKNRAEIMEREVRSPLQRRSVVSNPMTPAAAGVCAPGTSSDSTSSENSSGEVIKSDELSGSVMQISFLWQAYTPQYW
jgi:hypothetical protein